MRLAKALLDMCRSGCAPFNNLRLSIAPWFAASAKDKNSQLLKKTFQEKVEEAIAAARDTRRKRLKT